MSLSNDPARAELIKYGLLGTAGVLGTYYVLKGAIGDDTPDLEPSKSWAPGSDGEQLITFWIAWGVTTWMIQSVDSLVSEFQALVNP